jgi:hypothetical protein
MKKPARDDAEYFLGKIQKWKGEDLPLMKNRCRSFLLKHGFDPRPLVWTLHETLFPKKGVWLRLRWLFVCLTMHFTYPLKVLS